jgi:hypothetical protein
MEPALRGPRAGSEAGRIHVILTSEPGERVKSLAAAVHHRQRRFESLFISRVWWSKARRQALPALQLS